MSYNPCMNRLLTPQQIENIKEQANVLMPPYLDIKDPLKRVVKIAADNGIDIYEGNLFEMSGALRACLKTLPSPCHEVRHRQEDHCLAA